MKHPEVFLITILMLLDYYMTVLNNIKREKKASEFFKYEYFELNPIFQKAVSKNQWFNLHHLILTLLVTGLIVIFSELFKIDDFIVKIAISYLIVTFGMMVGRHLYNFFSNNYIEKEPNSLSGQLSFTHQYTLHDSMYMNFQVAIPIILIGILIPHPYVIGGILSIFSQTIVHISWIRKHHKQVDSKIEKKEQS